jgi:hypothetical protein
MAGIHPKTFTIATTASKTIPYRRFRTICAYKERSEVEGPAVAFISFWS